MNGTLLKINSLYTIKRQIDFHLLKKPLFYNELIILDIVIKFKIGDDRTDRRENGKGDNNIRDIRIFCSGRTGWTKIKIG